jgi:hypothetical protein
VISLWFVTPAWRRLALSAVCFEQRRQTIEELARHGIEAHCVVVADDENLELARAAGFDTVERDNQWLGRRFNDGTEHACRQGAEWVVPVGSDSWVDPAYFWPLPDPDVIRTATFLCTVAPRALAHLEVAPDNGAGPYMIHRSRLERSGFRPAKDRINRATDRSTRKGLDGAVVWGLRDLHRFQHISFRGTPHNTRYDALVRKWGVSEHRDPWPLLAQHWPPELVDTARSAIGG